MHEVLVSIPAGGVWGGKMGRDMWRTFLKVHGRFRNRIGPQALCIGYQVVGFILVKSMVSTAVCTRAQPGAFRARCLLSSVLQPRLLVPSSKLKLTSSYDVNLQFQEHPSMCGLRSGAHVVCVAALSVPQ